MDVLAIILGAAALLLIVVGLVLFCWGATREAGSAEPQSDDPPVAALTWLLKSLFGVIFGGKTYSREKRLMAQGLLLIVVGLIGGVAAAATGVAATA
ncbi:hypothetical protein [Streptomyces sp. YS-3]|uniref:hypothetical protein n=1 Tax=Streptomyces sp. YS-3 TaxID=3381352 RepID=UPI003862609A